jgi:hypothetical protein
MSFPRHREIFPSDGGASLAANASAHRLDEFPAGYSSAGCSPALPASASPAGHQYAVMSSCRSSTFHRTANCVLTVCVRRGGMRKPSRRSPHLRPPLELTAFNVQPAANVNLIHWQMDRDPTDTVPETGTPALNTSAGPQVTFQPSTAGGFRLIAYNDLNGNGIFDEGEQLGTVRFAIVRATLGSTARFYKNPGNPFMGSTMLGLPQVTSSQGNVPMALFSPYLLEGAGALG